MKIKQLFFILQLFFCRISQEIIHEVNDELFKNGSIEFSILNPFFGHIFMTNGCLSNLRFYSSEVIPQYFLYNGTQVFSSINSKRNYALDTSDDTLTKATIFLFPSPAGILTTSRNTDINFTKRFFSNFDKRNDNIKLLAEVFAKIFRKETYEGNPNEDNPNENILIKEKIMSETFYEALGSVILRDKNNLDQKLLLIHAYVIDVLDTKEEYKIYLTEIIERLGKDDIKIDTLLLSDKNLFKSIYSLKLSSFPYSQINQPLSNATMPCISTKNPKKIIKDTFSDCVDITILHLCNCMFFDEKTDSYNLDHLRLEDDSPLQMFYSKYNFKPFTITMNIRNEWSFVVQCLEDHNFSIENKYKPSKIFYLKNKYRNELKAGLINIMSVLAKICSSPNNDLINLYKNLMDDGITKKQLVLNLRNY